MTLTKNHPRRRCPKCRVRKRIRKGFKICYMCRKKTGQK